MMLYYVHVRVCLCMCCVMCVFVCIYVCIYVVKTAQENVLVITSKT